MSLQQTVSILKYTIKQGIDTGIDLVASAINNAPTIDEVTSSVIESVSGYVPIYKSPEISRCKFRKDNSYSDRLAMTRRILTKHPDRIPFVIIPGRFVPELDKFKFVIERSQTIAYLLSVIRSRIRLRPEQYIYIMIGEEKVFPSTYMRMSEIYEEYKSSDGFLYVSVELENAFG